MTLRSFFPHLSFKPIYIDMKKYRVCILMVHFPHSPYFFLSSILLFRTFQIVATIFCGVQFCHQIFIWIKRIYWISPASPWNSTTVITLLVPFTDICCYGVMFLFIVEKVTGTPKVIDPFKTQVWKKFLKSCLFEFLKWQSDYKGWQKKHGTLPNVPLLNRPLS